MKYKKGDLVKVIEVILCDEDYGIIEGETYKVDILVDDLVQIDAGKGNRVMYNHQLKKVKKKKSKKDLKIEELEKMNTDLLKIIMVLST